MFGMEAELDNGGRWDHIASEDELKRALSGKVRVIEWPHLNNTFICNDGKRTIVRCGALGGDQKDIEGGWVYRNPFSLQRDWNEIVEVANQQIRKLS